MRLKHVTPRYYSRLIPLDQQRPFSYPNGLPITTLQLYLSNPLCIRGIIHSNGYSSHQLSYEYNTFCGYIHSCAEYAGGYANRSKEKCPPTDAPVFKQDRQRYQQPVMSGRAIQHRADAGFLCQAENILALLLTYFRFYGVARALTRLSALRDKSSRPSRPRKSSTHPCRAVLCAVLPGNH